ncbi:MAG: hypothetical protein B7Z02_04580 [Rhodobacterales bacterium 32-67-9]|nr:MAG: hypothetical protein B7Z02_04580 [Rhodobacterales bacterium 32-67-9]
MYKRLFKLIIIFGAAAAAPPVHAQTATVCMERTRLIEQLEMRYHEAPAGIGLSSPSHLVEIWNSD